jgi:hypothetical protein
MMTTIKSKKLPLPDRIMVLGVPFQVEMIDCLETVPDDEEPTWGDTEGFKRRIRINSQQDTRRQWTTLYHEFLHAALYVIGSNLGDEVEEMVVQSLEHATEQFMLAHGEMFVEALQVQK